MALLDPNRLDVHKLANAKLAKFPSVAGVFHAAKWQSWIGRNHSVDKDAACFDFVDETITFGSISGPSGRAQTKRRRIGELDCFIEVGDTKQRGDPSKDFILIRRCAFGNVDQHRWFVEIPLC